MGLNNSQLSIGQLVQSRAGRDRGNIFLVADIVDSEYVLLIDGKLRKVEKPKKKKIKHIKVQNTVFQEYTERIEQGTQIDNKLIRKLLAPYEPQSDRRGV